MPAGLSFDASTGAITGSPTAASAATNYTVTVSNTRNLTSSQTFSLTVNPGSLSTTVAVASLTLTAGQASVNITPVTVTGGTAPLTYAVSTPLPAGLSFNTTTGAISGSPTAASAATNYTVTVTDANNVTSSQVVSLTVTPAMSATVPQANILVQSGTPVNLRPVVPAGGTTPLSFAITPVLPTGLMFTPDGVIVGEAMTSSGNIGYTVIVTDANNVTASGTFSLGVM